MSEVDLLWRCVDVIEGPAPVQPGQTCLNHLEQLPTQGLHRRLRITVTLSVRGLGCQLQAIESDISQRLVHTLPCYQCFEIREDF